MAHPLVLALYPTPAAAAAGARAAHAAGAGHDSISVVSRNHDEDAAFAAAMDATPGIELEDSRSAGRLGELSAYVLAAIAIVLPGVGPIVAAGPLAAGLGEAAGHAAGSLASALTAAGLPESLAATVQQSVAGGAVLIAVHADGATAPGIRAALERSGATRVDTANWTS